MRFRRERSMKRILFICHGNICRSPMAEFVMKDLVKKAGLASQFHIESAATSREEIGNPVYPPARRKLAEHGISCEGHAARQLTNRDYDEYDLLIGMDQANLRDMYRICGGDYVGKMSLLMNHTAHPGNVADPWYTEDFEATWQDVLDGCQGLLKEFMTERGDSNGKNDNIQLFEDKRIRTAWDEEKEEWYFSVVDVVAVLTDQPDYQAARNYWKVTKKRLKDEGNETVTACNQLKMTASDGKKRLTDVADTEQLLRIIQSIPSPKAEPFKLWLAQVGRERIEETIDPELTIDRALETYLKKGYSREWINQRLQAIQVRKELTDEWDARGVQKGVEYAILTDEISRAWSGMSTRQYKNLKGLKKENLRDNMTTLELVLNMLAEATTTQFSRDRKPTTFQENLAVAKAGGQVAGRTRKDIESQSDTPVITAKNAAQLNQVVTDLLEGAVSDTTEESKDK